MHYILSYLSREYENVCGSLPNVKNEILNLLNPIAIHHSIHFFVSVAIVWKEKVSNTEKNSLKMVSMSVIKVQVSS